MDQAPCTASWTPARAAMLQRETLLNPRQFTYLGHSDGKHTGTVQGFLAPERLEIVVNARTEQLRSILTQGRVESATVFVDEPQYGSLDRVLDRTTRVRGEVVRHTNTVFDIADKTEYSRAYELLLREASGTFTEQSLHF